MKSSRFLLCIVAMVAVLSSCQKEVGFQDDINPGGNGGGGQSIIGDYKYVYQAITYNNSLVDNTGGFNTKIILTGNVVGENPSGTVKITSDKYISTDLTYDINTVLNLRTYI